LQATSKLLGQDPVWPAIWPDVLRHEMKRSHFA
jgi:hypothetical protein